MQQLSAVPVKRMQPGVPSGYRNTVGYCLASRTLVQNVKASVLPSAFKLATTTLSSCAKPEAKRSS